MPHALIVDDDVDALEALEVLARDEGFTVSAATRLADARVRLEEQPPDLVLTDLRLPDGDGMRLLEEAGSHANMQVVVMTGYASVDTAVEALRKGASDYLTKPLDTSRLRVVLGNIKRTLELENEIIDLRRDLRELGRFGEMVGVAPSMQRVYELAAKVAPTSATVLITGESGTGKEVLARTLHRLSRRRQGAMLALNCGAVSPNLMESELFGHEKGSFTGAERQHRGYFERASGGTLFLDEITEMPYELQVKLLRVLETGRIDRVGGEEPVEVDVRIIAATNRSPEQAVEAGDLREDLLYRLKVFKLDLPPLREREGDVVLLAEHFLRELNRREDTSKSFSRTVLDILRNHSWPGNVRELKNVVEHAYILAGDKITRECLPIEMSQEVVTRPPVETGSGAVRVEPGTPLADVERELIERTLERFDGDKRRTARALGVSLKTLYNRLNAYKEGKV